MNWWKSSKTFPLRIFLVALILRLIPVLATRTMGIGLDDMFQYDMLARSIAAGNGYRWYAQEDLPLIEQYMPLDFANVNYDPRGVPTSFRPPLYPAFLAVVYLVAGVGTQRFFIARLVQVPLAAVLAPLTYALGRRFFPEKPRIGVIASWMIALYPLLVIYPLSLATENLFFVLVLASTLVLLKAADSVKSQAGAGPSPTASSQKAFGRIWNGLIATRWFILAGILLGLTALTRSVALGMAGLAFLWIWFGLHQPRMGIVLLAFLALVTVPWMVRNTIVDKRLTGIESALGYDLYVGYNPQGTGTFQYPISLDLMPIVDDGERDAIGREKALEFIRADPGRFPYLVVRRAGYFFGLERRALTYFYSNDYLGYIPTPLLLSIAFIVCIPFVIVSVSAAFGIAMTRWRKETRLLILLIVGYVTPHLFIIAEDRFHLAMVPFFTMLAAFFWSAGGPAMKAHWQTRRGRIALGLAVLATLLLCFNWTAELLRDSSKLTQLLSSGGNQTYFPY